MAAGAVIGGVVLSAAPSPAVIKLREWRAAHERQIVAELMQLVSLPNIASNKGPIVALLAAMDGLAETRAAVPWSLRIVLDGEEEAGSPNFTAAMTANTPAVRSDLAIVVDSPRHPSGLPTVFYGSRGVTGAQITIYGASGDLHSGNYGNFVTDPAMALTKLIASMKDDAGNVTIKGFYDGVVPLSATERRAIDEIPNVDQKLPEQFGLAKAEHPDSRIELQHNRPTLTVAGLQSGTVGASLPFSTFNDALKMPTIGLAVVNFDNNQHAINEDLRLGHLWEAIDIFAALVTMSRP